MKRCVCVLLTLLLCGLAAGCQTTPDAPVVTQKDMEQMIEKAQSSPEAALPATLREIVQAPERVQYSGKGNQGRLSIEVDAPVITPELSAMPILRVLPVDFDEATAKRFFDFFCAGEQMYDDTQRKTKSEIEREIVENEKLKAGDDYIDDPVGQAEIDKWTEVLKKEYLTAPETNEPALVDGSFYSVPVKDPYGNVVSSYMGISAGSDNAHFSVENSNGLDKPIVYEYDGGWSALQAGHSATLHFYRYEMLRMGRWGAVPRIPIEDESQVPPEAHGRLILTPAEARAMAEKLIEGTGFAVTKIYLECDLDVYNPERETRTLETANYGYSMDFIRMAGGIPCATAYSGHGGEFDKYALSWPYESMSIFITDAGIQDFMWRFPIKVADTVVESAALMPFGEIVRIFEKMAAVIYTEYTTQSEASRYMDDLTAEYGLNISGIRLEFRRVREQDNVETGLLLPVWSFYGHEWRTMKDGSTPGLDSNKQTLCLLTINAIDGSIIDVDRGY